ncbi:hypothetical protein BDN72DRAFT_896032 [Pluteus cervinus]|uniref:Uncharacterized protein n=1 Tax=Pluteus cervinus TaxID=181527 RepID=A0ACD3AZ91_9AGAR|nr:hypothetical protein BDN72DRAFT_896032 [Pluteus cervinus]
MAITLTSLPNELLLHIYKNLDHTDLYSQSKTCRTLHFVALHVLFQRHWNGFPSHKLELDLDGPPSRSLLRALQSALFLYDDIRYISVVFSMNIYMLYTQILTLTALVQRLKSLENLQLYLGRLQPWYSVQDPSKNPVIEFEQMTVALQGLMNTAFAKGCTDLIVSSGPSLESVRRGGIRGQLSGGIHGLVRQLGDMFTKTETGRPNLIWRGLTSIPGFRSKGGIVSSCRSVCIMADLLIHPASLDWTLRFLNHSHLTTLVIRWSGFSWEALRDILPRIYIPRLESCSFSGWRATPPDLVLFSQAHSRTISSISISIAYSSSDGVRWQPGSGATVHLDFPKLRCIKPSSAYLPWFFGAAGPIQEEPPSGPSPISHMSQS